MLFKTAQMRSSALYSEKNKYKSRKALIALDISSDTWYTKNVTKAILEFRVFNTLDSFFVYKKRKEVCDWINVKDAKTTMHTQALAIHIATCVKENIS